MANRVMMYVCDNENCKNIHIGFKALMFNHQDLCKVCYKSKNPKATHEFLSDFMLIRHGP